MAAALSRCVADPARFLADHWARRPLHRRAGEAAFADLLSLDDVDHIVSSSLPRSPTIRLVRDGQPLDPSRYTRTMMLGGRQVAGVGDAGRIWQEFSSGATVVLQALHRWWPPLTRFCRELELELTHPVQANAYITPAAARGLAVHHDTHDVFVLQVAGHKHWNVHPPVVELPVRSQPWSAHMGPPADALLSVELAPGDCLYVPRGFPHSARAQDGVSAHVTVGVLATTWADVSSDVLRGAVEEVAFRRPLAVGYARDEEALAEAVAEHLREVQEWLGRVDPRQVARRVARRFWATRPPVLAGHLRQLELAERVGDASTVRRRPAAACHLAVEGDRLVAVLGDREVGMPLAVEPAVRRL
ncbi:MAG: cupin domain-containing protein, partial [Actinomycetota bacterium]|nr:cupin domain-containing protein [Actinomycetota bacterium]